MPKYYKAIGSTLSNPYTGGRYAADRFALNGRAALLALIFSAHPLIGFSAPAAQVDFSVGNVTVTGPGGQSRALGKGAQIEQGDTVNTNGGRAQLRFTDGAYVSL